MTRILYYILGLLAVLGTFILISIGLTRFLSFFYIGIFSLGLAGLVYFQNRKSEINISFSAIIFVFAVWAIAIGMFLESKQVEQMFYWSRIYYIAGIFVPSVILYFSVVFPFESPVLTQFQKFLIFVPTLGLLPITLFTKGIVEEFFIRPDGFFAKVGPAYPFYFFYYLIFILMGIYFLYRKYQGSIGADKIRIRYIFWGFAALAPFATIFNMILPWMGDYNLIWVGPYFSVITIALISYAIVKHRLMSIEIVIQRGLIYTVFTGLIMMLFAAAVLFSEQIFRGLVGYSSIVLSGIVALIVAIVYQPLLRIFQDVTDRLFFRGHYDYQKTLRSVSSKIATKIRLEELTRLITTTFIETLGVSEISFLVYDRDRKRFRSVYLELPSAGGSRYKRIELDESSPIISWLKKMRDILILDELKEEGAVKEEMERLGVTVWVPIISKEELIGVISLGNKLSGDIYSYEDIALLFTLANQTAVALENARLYEEVLNAKNYVQEVLRSMVTGVLTVDTRGLVITFNPMAERITGLQAAAVLGRPYMEVFSPKSSLSQVIEAALKERSYTNFESNLVSPSRGLVPVSISTTVLYDSRGKKMGALLSLIDLTEVKELEGKVRQADKLGALGTMAAGMAHEIKNPLSSMKVLSQLLPIKYQDQEFRNKFIEIMPREISRIDRIVESLLGFARATSPKFEKVKVEELIEENLKYFNEQARKAGVKINRQYTPLPEIEGDHDQLSQVFSNLILNAIQAMPEGGELTVLTQEGKKTENILQNIRIEVSDTGHGIPEENLKKLFDPFFTTKYAGTGLGLTISHSIVDGHRGFIDVKSELGKGTRFTITLPVSQELI
jgi:PAS domain S-box-containing protein